MPTLGGRLSSEPLPSSAGARVSGTYTGVASEPAARAFSSPSVRLAVGSFVALGAVVDSDPDKLVMSPSVAARDPASMPWTPCAKRHLGYQSDGSSCAHLLHIRSWERCLQKMRMSMAIAGVAHRVSRVICPRLSFTRRRQRCRRWHKRWHPLVMCHGSILFTRRAILPVIVVQSCHPVVDERVLRLLPTGAPTSRMTIIGSNWLLGWCYHHVRHVFC